MVSDGRPRSNSDVANGPKVSSIFDKPLVSRRTHSVAVRIERVFGFPPRVTESDVAPWTHEDQGFWHREGFFVL